MTLKRFAAAPALVLVGAVASTISAQTPAPRSAQSAPPAAQSAKTVTSAEWIDYAGSPEGNRYVALDQFTKANVGQLDVAWTYPYAETGFNPIVAHGVIYTRARNSSVVALDAATGKEIWIHDGLSGITRRGMNYWESKDGRDRRLIFWVADYMQEIDANTGKSVTSFGKDGAVDLRDELRRDPNYIREGSGTPGKVWEDLIIIGSSTGEGFFSPPGDVRAYNVVTGKLVWQFHTVPHPGEFGYETWPKDAWKYIGGVNTWGEISVDSARGIAYFPLGSPTFDFYGADRAGDGLFGTSLLALDARTGKRLWHFQNVHHDLWDYDNVAAPQLTTITKGGKKIDVVAMAGKTGYLYVFNRVTGEPIWPIPETPVPHETSVPGEVVSPTQPIPTAPPPFTPHTFTADDVNPYILTDKQRADMIGRVKAARFQGVFTPIGFDDVIHMPGNQGGTNWGMTSANPTDGSVYVMAYNMPTIMRLLPAGQTRGRGGRGGPGAALYTENCAVCHGADRSGRSGMPSLVSVASRMNAAEIRARILEGRGQMPAFEQLHADQVDALVTFLTTANAGRGRGGRGGRAMDFSPGPVVQTGPVTTRPPAPADAHAMNDYPEGAPHPDARLTMNDYGVEEQARKPPYTTLTAYDLNKGTIKWQIGAGDDYRVLQAGGPHGTGAATTMKSSVLVTSTGLVIVNTADRKIHIYDADNGKEIRAIPLGSLTSGSNSMYELNGKQYLLVTASPVGTGQGNDDKAADPNQKGPVGMLAYTLKP
jgi:quinoprotein glucose dehydrogenase